MAEKPVKVSGIVPPEQHERLRVLASEHCTTIGAIVSYAVSLALTRFAKYPRELAQLPQDARPDNNRRMFKKRP